MKKAPGGLTAVCVIAMVLGGMGFFGAVLGIVGAAAGEAMQNAFQPGGPPNPQMEQIQEKMEREVKEVTDKWKPVTYALLAVQFVVVACLFIGGLQAMRLQPFGHRLLLIAFLLAIVFELVRAIPNIAIQLATVDIMERYMAEVMKAVPGGGAAPPPGFNRMMQTTMKVSMFIGLAFAAIWLLLKLGFYGFGVHYLRRPHVQAVFEEETDPLDVDWGDDI